MNKSILFTVETTVASEKDARTIISAVLDKQFAACVHISKIESTYIWKGRIEKAEELKLVFKTTSSKANSLISFIEKIHPYEVPEILMFRVDKSAKSYENWVLNETNKQTKIRKMI